MQPYQAYQAQGGPYPALCDREADWDQYQKGEHEAFLEMGKKLGLQSGDLAKQLAVVATTEGSKPAGDADPTNRSKKHKAAKSRNSRQQTSRRRLPGIGLKPED